MKKNLLYFLLISASILLIYYFGYYQPKKKQALELEAYIFSDYCNTNRVCDIDPERWIRTQDSGGNEYYAKKFMAYKVSKDRKTFEISEKIATGITYTVKGGVDKEVLIEKIVD